MNEPRLKVLLVEDDPEDYLIVRNLLREIPRTKFDLDWAETYEDALKAMDHGRYDACLLDYRLGEHNGLELLQRSGKNKECGFPVILLTGRGDYVIDVEAMKAGAVDYLVKDQISADLLERVLRYAVERKRSEEIRILLDKQLCQAQKMEEIGRLAGGIAHDFNNLLMAILGYNEFLMANLDANGSAHRYAVEIHNAAARAADFTKQLLAFSRCKLLEPKVLDINIVVANLEKLLQRLIGEDIDLITVLQPGQGRVKADQSQIERVIMNLAVNARDAMPDGGSLTIETKNVDLDGAYARLHASVQPGPYVMLAVSDTGFGIDRKILPHIFEPLFTTKDQGKGTGLGLFNVCEIIKQSGGHIWVYSEPEYGTTFKIYLPGVEDAADATEPCLPKAVPAKGAETILLVEDEEMVRTLISESLSARGYTVLVTCHGQEALAVCQKFQEPIHMVMTDVIMPGMNGWELSRRVAPLHPEAKMLFMSGYTENSAIGKGIMESGATFLSKPFTPSVMNSKVREVLDGP